MLFESAEEKYREVLISLDVLYSCCTSNVKVPRLKLCGALLSLLHGCMLLYTLCNKCQVSEIFYNYGSHSSQLYVLKNCGQFSHKTEFEMPNVLGFS